MNRRSFFKMLTGFAVGAYAAFVPNKAQMKMYILPTENDVEKFSKAELDPLPFSDVRQKRSGTEFICNALCDCVEQRITEIDNRISVSCPHLPPYFVNSDGTKLFESYPIEFLTPDIKWFKLT